MNSGTINITGDASSVKVAIDIEINDWLLYVTKRAGESDIVPRVPETREGQQKLRDRAEELARYHNCAIYVCRIEHGVAPKPQPVPVEWEKF
jgi:hypothetical protein